MTITPSEHRENLIIAQNQSTVAAELTKIWAENNKPADANEILKHFIGFRASIIKDFNKRYKEL